MSQRIYCHKVLLDRGGYVRRGQSLPRGMYFGVGSPLYYYAALDSERSGTVRADSRTEALAKVQAIVRSSA